MTGRAEPARRSIGAPAIVVALVALVAAACGAGGSGATDDGSTTTVGAASGAVGTTGQGPAEAVGPVATGASTTVTVTVSEPPGPDPERALPRTAAQLAVDLAETEATIRDPTVGDAEAAAWGRRQQRLYRLLAGQPTWYDETVAGIDDPGLRRAVELNWRAREALTALVASHGPEAALPAWRVTEPRPAGELLGYYHEGEARWGIDWTYLAAINLIETRMGRIQGLSSAGAVGPMQFLPTTWAECCEGDPTEPADAIPGAARYLTIRGGPEDMERAIWGYNNSDHYVEAVTSYAAVLADDEAAYRGYHAWEVFFASTEGLIHIPVGYDEAEPVPADRWIAEHPDTLLSGPD